MNKFIVFILLIVAFSSCQKQRKKTIDIIPEPQKIEEGNSVFALNKNPTIYYGHDEALDKLANYFIGLTASKLGYNYCDHPFETEVNKK